MNKIEMLVDFYNDGALDQEDELDKQQFFLSVIRDLLEMLDEEILNQEFNDRIGGLNE